MTTGLLVMAYGTASGPDDIERYYTDIRGGRTPSPEHLAELVERYQAIGNVFPLLDTTTAQADGIVERLCERYGEGSWRAYLGMKHSAPFIADGIAQMRADGIERAIGIVMAPHWASLSVDTYLDRAQQAIASDGGPALRCIRQWYDGQAFISFLAARVAAALDRLDADERADAEVVFSAHSLPIRELDDGSQRCLRCEASECEARCTYAFQLQDTADRVARELGLETYRIAWQSAGRTADPWWGPPVEEVIPSLAKEGRTGVVVCSAGFVADHLETLFDLDIEAREIAAEAGIAFERTEMPNADPVFLDVLAEVVAEYAEQGAHA